MIIFVYNCKLINFLDGFTRSSIAYYSEMTYTNSRFRLTRRNCYSPGVHRQRSVLVIKNQARFHFQLGAQWKVEISLLRVPDTQNIHWRRCDTISNRWEWVNFSMCYACVDTGLIYGVFLRYEWARAGERSSEMIQKSCFWTIGNFFGVAFVSEVEHVCEAVGCGWRGFLRTNNYKKVCLFNWVFCSLSSNFLLYGAIQIRSEFRVSEKVRDITKKHFLEALFWC